MAEHDAPRVALFTERNPEPGVAVFHFSARSGRARRWPTRMRLATSPAQVLAVAHLGDGSYWQAAVDVIVTLAAHRRKGDEEANFVSGEPVRALVTCRHRR
ncbi:MAG: thiosulfate oxidation carrier protein SoxY [Rubrivivax sp.]